jgi:folylpolyglutamate synthase/dihydropteroate synthase
MLSVIYITGTKGKGSTATYTESHIRQYFCCLGYVNEVTGI